MQKGLECFVLVFDALLISTQKATNLVGQAYLDKGGTGPCIHSIFYK